MTTLYYFFVILVMLLGSGPFATAATRAAAHKATHQIEVDTKVDGGSVCSATAVGPQALLTASHCELPTDKVTVDGDDAKIVKIIRDDNDHSLFLLTGVRFKDWARVSLKNEFEMGDRIFIFGNPDGLTDIYREGYMAGQTKFSDVQETLWDLNGFFGDSGSALFNTDGVIVAVMSLMKPLESSSSKIEIKFMGTLPLAFTDAQIKEATDYCKTCTAPKPKNKKDDTVSQIIKIFEGTK